MEYGYVTRMSCGFDEAVEAVTRALKSEGFGVLTEIDVRETLRKKLDIDFRPYKILGACNPVLAHRALQADPEIGLLLPCNVVVQETPEGVTVSIANPRVMSTLADDSDLGAVVEEANARIEKVVASLT